MAGIQIPVGVKFDSESVAKQIQMLNDQIKVLGHTVAQAQKVEFNPISAKSKEDMQGIIKQSQQLLKVNTELQKLMKATGQGGVASPLLADWSKLYPDQGQRLQKMRQFLQGMGNEFSRGPWTKPDYASGSGARPPRPPRPGGAGSAEDPIPNAPVPAAPRLPAMGAAVGLGSFLGGLGLNLLTSVASQVMQKLGDSQQLSMMTDRVLRSSGAMTDFNSARRMLYAGSSQAQMGVNEFTQMSLQYQRASGFQGDAYDLARQVGGIGQFARGYGLEPNEATGVFASANRVGATRNETETRKLGLMIGEGIGRSRAFSSMDRFASTVGSYIEQTARSTMTMPNISGYIGAMTSLMNTGPGTDVEGSAAMLAQVDAAIKRGGNAGEAGTNFRAQVAQANGLDPYQESLMRAGGAFATKSNILGKGSDYQRIFGGNQTGDKTELEMLMQGFKKRYAGQPQMGISAMSNFFGINPLLAQKLYQLRGSDISGTSNALQNYGVDISKIDMSAVPDLVRIQQPGRGGANAVASQLLNGGKLTAEEKDTLAKAQNGSEEELKKVVSQLVATHGQAETEGSQTRKSINEVSNAIQKQSDLLVAPLNVMKMALVQLAGGSEADIEDKYWAGKTKDAEVAARAKYTYERGRLHEANVTAFSSAGSKEAQAATEASYRDLNNRENREVEYAKGDVAAQRLRSSVTPEMLKKANDRKITPAEYSRLEKLRPYFEEAGKKYNEDPDLLMGIAVTESRVNNASKSGKGAQGIMQVVPRWAGNYNLADERENIMAGAAILHEKRSIYGNQAAVPAYNAGNPRNFQNPETRDYVPRVDSAVEQIKTHNAEQGLKLHPDSVAAIGEVLHGKLTQEPLRAEVKPGNQVPTRRSVDSRVTQSNSWNRQ
ncbi:lytic transglycosylase domain-containing protein [Escherichia coli]